MHSPRSTFSKVDIYGIVSQLKFTRPIISSIKSIRQLKVPGIKIGQEYCTSRVFADGPFCALKPQFHSQFGSLYTGSLPYVFKYGSSSEGKAFPKRYFSQAPRILNKNWKQLAPHSQRSGASTTISAIKVIGDVIHDDQQAGDIKKNVIKKPKTKVKEKQLASNKKNKEDQPKSVLKAKKLNKIKSDQDPLASEKNINGKTVVKTGTSSSSSNETKSKKTTKSTGKVPSVEKNTALLKRDEACINAITIESVHNQKLKATPKTKHTSERTLYPLYPPRGKSVVVVESATKAKVIQGYLGDKYVVLPSYGHVRDLAAKSGSVRPDDDFSMVWEVPSAAWPHLKCIKAALSGAENLILASDPDREGEAIAWHVFEMLQQQNALHDDITVARVVFHEITETSIKAALQTPRKIDVNLVDAYLARRALDYLIGFNISPLLWRKLPGCSSAGRVQSAALSLICDREMEIDKFKPQEYWSVEALFKKNNISFSSNLTHFGSEKLNQFSISSHIEANDIEQKITSSNFKIVSCKKSKIRKNPPTPYITSTLQQDAASKLHFTATYTMKLAQRLYEGIQLAKGEVAGLITYTRTDGLHISNGALEDIRSLISKRYGSDFAPDSAREYLTKVKNAQEAHEAIRPTDIRMLPSMLVGMIDEDSLKLYALIWSRTMACQMELAIIDQIQLDIGCASEAIYFRTSCSRVSFLGYQAVYKDVEAQSIRHMESEGNERDEVCKGLDSLKKGDSLCLEKVGVKQHSTYPPSRYSEGSLVKKLEELGIGRPSTYASTIRVLQDRKYVTAKSRVLYPEFRGRMVSAYLANQFSEVTDYSFTADMETELDNVSAGTTEWKGLLTDYWKRFSSNCNEAKSVHIHEVEKMMEKTFGDIVFASLPDKSRTCPSCKEGTLNFKVSRFGAGYFIGCDQHPTCKFIAKTLYGQEGDDDNNAETNTILEEPKLLGLNPGSSEKILLKKGPYGFYVQLGEDRKEKGYVPKRASVSQIKDVNSITLEDAIELLRYPVILGNHPKDDQPVVIKLAKIGHSVRHKRKSASVPKDMNIEDITLEQALNLLSSKDVTKTGRPKAKSKKVISRL